MTNCVNTSNLFWKIENFCSVDKEVSSVFSSLGLKWQLRFSRMKVNDTQNFFLFLDCLNTLEMSPFWKFKAAVGYVSDGVGCTLLKQMATYDLKDDLKEWCIWSENVKEINDQYGQIKDFTFYVRIMPVDLSTFFKNQKTVEIPSESACVSSLIEDFEELFNNDECSDFILKCADRSFSVHKAVLSARSDFFLGMFRSKMKEVKEGTANIDNIEPNILEMVLRYIYTGQIPELTKETLKKVYAAADRLGVEPLKVKCCSLFIDNFMASPKEDCDENTKKETSNLNKPTKGVKAKSQLSKENKLLKDLFTSKEWRAFSLEFPNKAQEICKPFLLKN